MYLAFLGSVVLFLVIKAADANEKTNTHKNPEPYPQH